MSLLIRSEKDLPLLEKAHIAKKLNKLSKTISESFARKIYGEDPKKPIQFSKDPDKTKTVKVQFAKVKDHLLSKIHEARDTSFYNILALYFEQYFKLIKHGEKESNHMTDAQFNQFLEEINDLNEQLGIVYEQVYPEDYKGYILMQVDRSNLDQPPFSLTGTLMRDEPDDDCKFTGQQLTQIDPSKTFTDIEKHRQIKYIGGKEYYMSMGEYGTIYLQGNVDSRGEKRGNDLRMRRAMLLKRMSSGDFDLDDDDDESLYGDDDGIDYGGDDYRGFRGSPFRGSASASFVPGPRETASASFVPGPRETATLSSLRTDAVPRPSLVPPAARPTPPALTPETPKPGPKRDPPKKASSAGDLPQEGLKPALKRGSASKSQVLADAAAVADKKALDEERVAGKSKAEEQAERRAAAEAAKKGAVATPVAGAEVVGAQVVGAEAAGRGAAGPSRERDESALLPAGVTSGPAALLADQVAAAARARPGAEQPPAAQVGGRRKKHKKSKKYYKKTQAKKRKKTKKR